jgi:hypothetical protein
VAHQVQQEHQDQAKPQVHQEQVDLQDQQVLQDNLVHLVLVVLQVQPEQTETQVLQD